MAQGGGQRTNCRWIADVAEGPQCEDDGFPVGILQEPLEGGDPAGILKPSQGQDQVSANPRILFPGIFQDPDQIRGQVLPAQFFRGPGRQQRGQLVRRLPSSRLGAGADLVDIVPGGLPLSGNQSKKEVDPDTGRHHGQGDQEQPEHETEGTRFRNWRWLVRLVHGGVF